MQLQRTAGRVRESPAAVEETRGPNGFAGMTRLVLIVIGFYRVLLSPFLGGHCRYLPSCSQYAAEAVQRHGAWRGGKLAVRRVLRCHPLAAGGFDPVP